MCKRRSYLWAWALEGAQRVRTTLLVRKDYGVIRVFLLTLYRVRLHAACLSVHGSIAECVVTSKDWILSLRTADMFRQVHALWRRLSQRPHCSDGSVSVTIAVELASLVLPDILLPLCPVATEEVLLCLHVDKGVHTPSHVPTLLLGQQHKTCPSSWSRAPSSRGWLQKRCLLPRGSTLCRGPPSPMYPLSN